MKRIVLITCLVAIALTATSAAMASDDYWVVKFKAGYYSGGSTANNDTLVIGASAATAGGSDTFSSTVANVVSVADGKFIGTHRVAPVTGSTYSFTMLVAPGTGFPDGTGETAGKFYISAWSPDSYLGTPGRALPENYTVRVQGEGVDVTWSYSDLYLTSDPVTTGVGPVGFWYSYGLKSSSYTDANANDFFTVTVAPVPEPGSMLALGSGLVGMAGFALRRRRA